MTDTPTQPMTGIDLLARPVTRTLVRSLARRLPRFRTSNPAPSISAAQPAQQPTHERGDW